MTIENDSLDHTDYGFGLKLEGHIIGHEGAYKTAMTMNVKTGSILIFMVQIDGPQPRPDDFRDRMEAVANTIVQQSARQQ